MTGVPVAGGRTTTTRFSVLYPFKKTSLVVAEVVTISRMTSSCARCAGRPEVWQLEHPGGPMPRSTDSPLRPRSTVLARGRHHAGPPLQLQDPASAGPRFGTPRRQRESYTTALRGDRAQQGLCNRFGGHRRSAPALLCWRSTQGRARMRRQTRAASAARRCACRWTWWSHPRGVRRRFRIDQSERRSVRSASTLPTGGHPCRPPWPRLSMSSTDVTPHSPRARQRRSRARRRATTLSSAPRASRWRCSRYGAIGMLSPRKRGSCRRSPCGRKRRRPGANKSPCGG